MLHSRNKRPNSGRRQDSIFNQELFGFGGFGSNIMKNFGMGFERDFFNMDMLDDPFDEIQSFSKLHKKAHDKKSDGAFYCETYVQSSKMGDNGKMITQKYYDRNYGQHKGGNTISEKQQAYQNSKGQRRLAEEQMINNKGRKVIKDKHLNGEIQEKFNYYNIDPEDNFELEWNNMNRQIGFKDNIQKLGYGNKRNPMEEMMALEDHPRQNNNRTHKSSYNNGSKIKQLGYDNVNYDKSQQRSGNISNYKQSNNKFRDSNNNFGESKQYMKEDDRNSKYKKSNSVYRDNNVPSTKSSKFKDMQSFGKGSYKR